MSGNFSHLRPKEQQGFKRIAKPSPTGIIGAFTGTGRECWEDINHPAFYLCILNTYRACNVLKCFSTPCYHTLLYLYHVEVTPHIVLTSGRITSSWPLVAMLFASFITLLLLERREFARGWWAFCENLGMACWIRPLSMQHHLQQWHWEVGQPSWQHILVQVWRAGGESNSEIQPVPALDHLWDADVGKELGRRCI